MLRTSFILAVLTVGVVATSYAQEVDPYTDEGTYSIIGRDPDTGELGMGVQSRAFAVGYRTWTARGGLAIFAHQASSNPYYGRVGMEMLAAGLDPQEALDRLVRSDVDSARRPARAAGGGDDHRQPAGRCGWILRHRAGP